MNLISGLELSTLTKKSAASLRFDLSSKPFLNNKSLVESQNVSSSI